MKFIFGFLILAFIGIANINFTRPSDGSSRPLPKNMAELGEELFFDPILSKDYTISCASCHKPEFAFADSTRLSEGVESRHTARNTPSVMYTQLSEVVFWDGRARSLEHQVFFPITHPDEMGLAQDDAILRLKKSPYYNEAFKRIFKEAPTRENASTAIAEFERSLSFWDAPIDRFYKGNDTALSPAQIRGLTLFIGKANCWRCHNIGIGKDPINQMFNIGTFNGKEYNDPGWFGFTKDSADLGKFKVPQLRNLKYTAPYMHDGSVKTIREVMQYYNKPADFVKGSINRDTLSMKDSLGLTEQNLSDLEAFMEALVDNNFEKRMEKYKKKAEIARNRERKHAGITNKTASR